MSDLTQVKKTKGLGRGIGSLIGESTRVDAFEDNIKTEPKVEVKAEPKPVLAAPKTQTLEENKEALRQVQQVQKEIEQKIPDNARIWKISVEKLFANPKQPRKEFTAEALKELSNSIKEKGILQPIVCRKASDGRFEIIAGERRWRASQLAGLHEVPVILKETSNQEALELALIENIQRQDLNPVEEAEAYNHLVQTYNLTQQQLADKMGKDRATVANMLRLLNLGPEVRRMLIQKELSLGQAKVLLAITDLKLQVQLAQKIVREKLSVRATEKLIKAAQAEPKIATEKQIFHSKLIEELRQQLQKSVGTKVSIDYNDGKGKLGIYFYSDEQLNNLAEKVKSSWSKI